MPNPFPGMNPYLEANWGDIHSRLVLYSCDLLRPGLPGDLYARVEERVVVETPDEEGGQLIPDISIVEHPQRRRTSPPQQSGVAVAEPTIVQLPEPEFTETYIVIRDAKSGNNLVTVIEFLSASNKHPGAGRRAYKQKADAVIQAGVSLVEIDLLRAGTAPTPFPEHIAEKTRKTPYRVCVRRSVQPSFVEVYSIPLQMRLPPVRIPLRLEDDDVRLDLQALIESAYENGNYELTIDYRRDPEPPLDENDAGWADALLKEHGLR